MRQILGDRLGSGSGLSLSEAELASVMNELRQLSLVVRRCAAVASGGPGTPTSDAGLSATERLLLRQLDDRPASSISELARRVHADRSGVSVSVRTLANRGLVVRESSPSDRRMASISLTMLGRDALAARAGQWLPSGPAVGLLSRGDLRELAGKLARLARTLLETTEVSAA
jgi:DNA-binding MarR family transcriptional regulator